MFSSLNFISELVTRFCFYITVSQVGKFGWQNITLVIFRKKGNALSDSLKLLELRVELLSLWVEDHFWCGGSLTLGCSLLAIFNGLSLLSLLLLLIWLLLLLLWINRISPTLILIHIFVGIARFIWKLNLYNGNSFQLFLENLVKRKKITMKWK